MLKISVNTSLFGSLKADVAIVLIVAKNTKHIWVNRKKLKDFGYKCEGAFFDQSARTLYIPIDALDADSMREAGAIAVRALKSYPFAKAKIGFYANDAASSDKCELMYAFAIGALCGGYSFDMFKSKKQESALQEIIISTESYRQKGHARRINTALIHSLNVAIDQASILAESTNNTRDLVNTPPQLATPAYIAEQAKNIASKHGLKCQILQQADLEREKMGAMLAVARASTQAPYLIHLSYIPEKKSRAKIALVGKGLTYDSGGLSLKPADYMTTMKADKGGGCATLGIISAVAQLKLDVEVHAIIGAVENMIGGDAYKPDDVLISREGKTIEVKNTDAEGRLVLCDCLSYAQDLQPDFLVDFATLTGACVVGLGEYTSGVMGYNERLKEQFEQSALKSGELAAKLPFNKHIKKLLDSKIADISNISSSRYGGAISAGMFLGEFIRDEYKQKWLHIDIAGPAFVEKEWDINPYGASGAGVRAGVEFVLSVIARSIGRESERRGRPRKVANAAALGAESSTTATTTATKATSAGTTQAASGKRGRPKGSKNKPKDERK